MKRASITAIIPAHNEEKNIERCIKSVSWCDKVQILWMGDDRTGKMAKSLGAYVIELNKSKESNFLKVQENINWAIDHATTYLILRVDADEVTYNLHIILRFELEIGLIDGTIKVSDLKNLWNQKIKIKDLL